MQTRKLPGEVQAETVARDLFAHGTAMETLEDMFSCRAGNGVTSVAQW